MAAKHPFQEGTVEDMCIWYPSGKDHPCGWPEDCDEHFSADDCDECDGRGEVWYTCGEGTCDNYSWCDCVVGQWYRQEMENQRRIYLLRRMDEKKIWDCQCGDCCWARQEV